MTDKNPMTSPSDPQGHDKPKCGSKTTAGGQCRRPAGWGTAHAGIGACKLHGGSTPNHNRHAQVVQAQRDVELFKARVDIHPAEALLELVQWTAGEVDYWRQEVRLLEREDLTWGVTKEKTGGDDRGVTEEAKPHIAYAMLIDASNRLERYASSALKAGVDERQVRIAEDQGRQLYGAFVQVFALLELDERQQALVPSVVPGVLRALSEVTS